ncbi:hypothetical protein KW787_00530 [Candidatus Pacearchaeota archaeon]|nr:hypothetical protein [Candidatus Pacearchaeota archaeon]
MKRGQIVWDALVPWIIAIGAAVLLFLIYLILTDKATNALDYLRNLFRFGK